MVFPLSSGLEAGELSFDIFVESFLLLSGPSLLPAFVEDLTRCGFPIGALPLALASGRRALFLAGSDRVDVEACFSSSS